MGRERGYEALFQPGYLECGDFSGLSSLVKSALTEYLHGLSKYQDFFLTESFTDTGGWAG